jgi:PPK2 family polyphosphate:nucleotide phosphotransferase
MEHIMAGEVTERTQPNESGGCLPQWRYLSRKFRPGEADPSEILPFQQRHPHMSKRIPAVDGKVDLQAIDPANTGKLGSEDDVADRIEHDLKELYDLAYLMFADNRRSLLIVLQGIDASGKDGLTRHIASGLNPQGFKVHSFKQPSEEELDHDYLWRIHRAMPARGEIAIFNRSHYEEVTVLRVHPELLQAERLPEEIANANDIFKKRYRQINRFEEIMVENGTVIVKFFLHISIEEQNRRFAERLSDPHKHWKFSKQDILEQQHWDAYRKAFEAMLHHTSTDHAPWYIIPADKKWYRNYMAHKIVIDTLRRMKMSFPSLVS